MTGINGPDYREAVPDTEYPDDPPPLRDQFRLEVEPWPVLLALVALFCLTVLLVWAWQA